MIFAVPPSRPSCSQSGQTSVGGSAALKCSSSTGAPKPVYNWIRLGASPTPSPGSMVQGKGPGHQGGWDSEPGQIWPLNSTQSQYKFHVCSYETHGYIFPLRLPWLPLLFPAVFLYHLQLCGPGSISQAKYISDILEDSGRQGVFCDSHLSVLGLWVPCRYINGHDSFPDFLERKPRQSSKDWLDSPSGDHIAS